MTEAENRKLRKQDGKKQQETQGIDSSLSVADSSPTFRGDDSLRIVGIGASAGGLEAFIDFFAAMPPDSGLAFVLVQHLDPTRESLLPEILQRHTAMPVAQVRNGMNVEPNCVYVIPPHQDLALLHGSLHLIEPIIADGVRLSIDFFFHSLAQDQAERAIGIVLSGTGTDGTLGLKAIKEVGGMVMVQDGLSAKYDGMPSSAVATGLADFVMPPGEMPEQLLAYIQPGTKKVDWVLPEFAEMLQKVFIILRRNTGHDFSLYKSNTISRRIERRMVINQIDRLPDYIRYLQQSADEVEILFRELLIGVTSFFRDPEAFEVLEQDIIPRLFQDRAPDRPIRAWVCGCSTGEEAYSIAILLREQMDSLKQDFETQIFATDIDHQAVEQGRLGLYPSNIAAHVSPERLQRYFVKEDDGYRVSPLIRNMVVFATQSLIKDPPFSKQDLISCRNMLIYLGTDLQQRILPLFHYALNPGGFLFLGSSETLGNSSHFFNPINRKWKLFQRIEIERASEIAFGLVPQILPNAPLLSLDIEKKKSINVREMAEQLLLDTYTPPYAVIDDRSQMLYLHNRSGHYFVPETGTASLDILRMVRPELKIPLATTIRRAMAQKEESIYPGVRLQVNHETKTVRLIVRPIRETPLWLVVFEDTGLSIAESAGLEPHKPGESHPRIAAVEQELEATKEYLQATIEQLQSTNEELRSLNEELQSANEELQSANEELVTSREELQSVNEELVTVNTAYQSKLEEQAHANNDLNNLLASIEIGIIFLDLALNIQRFNSAATNFVNLIKADVGRPFEHIVSKLEYKPLINDVQDVLDTLIPKTIEVRSDKRWYRMRIRPYRTAGNAIDGVVITFAEITEQKDVQEQLRKFSRAVEQSSSMIFITDIDGTIEYANRRLTDMTGYTLEELVGQNPRILKSDKHSSEYYRQLWQTIMAGREWHGDLCNQKKNGKHYWVAASISPIRDDSGNITHFVSIQEHRVRQE
jgi:two-component system CheB/CheR fusion protein